MVVPRSRPARFPRTLSLPWLAAGAVALSGTAPTSARAANTAWSNTPATPLFSNPNWTANATTPGLPGANVASGDALYFGPSTLTNLTNDNAGFTYAGVTFNAGASAFTLGGNGFTLGGNLLNNAATVQTLTTSLVLDAARTATINAGGGSLALNGGISGAFSLTATTAFAASGGPNALVLNPVVLGGANAFSGNLVLSNGAVRLNNAGALNGSVGVTVANNTANALVFGTDAPLANSALPVSLYGIAGGTTNSLVLDRATAGPGVTQTIGSLAPQANSLLRVVGGPNATGPGTLVVTGATTLTARLASSVNGATLYASGANVVLGAVNTLAVLPASPVTPLTSAALLLDGDSTGNRITGPVGVNNGLTKAGPGTWALSGASTISGNTTVSGGTLRLDFAATGAPGANILPAGGALTFNGGTLEVVGNGTAASSQSFTNGTQLSQGGSRLVATATPGAPVTVNLGGISPGAGGTLDVTVPAGSSVVTASVNGPNGLLNSSTNNGGGAVTLNGVNFAMNSTNANGGSLVPFTAYAALPVSLAGTATGADPVRSLTGSQTQATATGFSALRIADSGAGQSLNLNGNNLVLPAVSTILQAGGTTGNYLIDSTVAGSRVTTTNGTGEIVVNTAAGQTLTVSSANDNLRQASDSTAFTKTGDGTLVIGNRNFFQPNISSGANGPIRVTGGTLATESLPTGVGTIYLNGGALRYTGSFAGNFNNQTLSVGGNGGTLDAAGAGGAIVNFQGVLAYENVAASARVTLTGASTAGNVFSPATGIADPRATASGGTSLVKTGPGAWTVGFGNNPYSGGTSILGGTLTAAGGAFNASSPFISTTGLGTGSVTVGDGAGQNATLVGGGNPSAIVLAGANRLTVNAGSALRPGGLTLVGNQTDSAPAFGAATLNLASGSFYDVDIAGISAFDRLRLFGDAALNGATLRLTLEPNVIPTNQQFIILDNDGTADAITGQLTNGFSIVAGNNTGTYLFTINYAGGDGNDLVLNGIGIVPEPGTWTLLALGGVALAGISRRRRR